MKVIPIKICFCGGPRVGKTSLIDRFVKDNFDDEYGCTIGTNISKKLVEVPYPVRGKEMK